MANTDYNTPPKNTHNPKLLTIFLKPIIMLLIIFIFLIFLGLATIVLLNIFLAGTFVNRHRRRKPTTDFQNHLPTFQYSASTTSDDCSICLECFTEGEVCRELVECKHLFHAQCVDSWLVEVHNCPVCRTPVRMDVDRPSDTVVSDDESKFLWAVGVAR